MKTAKGLFVGLVVAAVLQTGALGAIIYKHLEDLRTGVEVVLKSNMRDPRDFFRGHYTRLQLDVERIDPKTVSLPDLPLKTRQDVFIVLKPGEDGFWKASAVSATAPSGGVFLKGVTSYVPPNAKPTQPFNVSLPFSRYYAPKRRALELEALNRDQKLGIILAVQADGTAKIKGISVDGKLIHDETLL